MQATDWIKKKAKSSTTIKTAANVLLRVVTSSSWAPTISNNNTFFSRLFNTLWGTITLIPQNLNAKILRLIKKGKSFNYKGKGHIMLNCLEKARISINIDASDIDNIENIDQGKK